MNYPSPLKLDIACGSRKPAGFIGIDVAALPGVDVVQDLEKYPWPFDDNSVDEARCWHYIEHVKELMPFMNEIHRIMKVGARLEIMAPYGSSIRAYQDPTHIRPIFEWSFLYYNKEWREQNDLAHYPITADFDFQYGHAWTAEWANRSEEARAFALRHYMNVVTDIQVTMTKKDPAAPVKK